MKWSDPGSCSQRLRGRVSHQLRLSLRNSDCASRLDSFDAILQKDEHIFSKVVQNQIFTPVVAKLENAQCVKSLFSLSFFWASEIGSWLGYLE